MTAQSHRGFVRGDRVKLTDRAAEQQTRGYWNSPRHHVDGKHLVDWPSRRDFPWSAGVSVKWDDRTSGENWPKAMVELALDRAAGCRKRSGSSRRSC